MVREGASDRAVLRDNEDGTLSTDCTSGAASYALRSPVPSVPRRLTRGMFQGRSERSAPGTQDRQPRRYGVPQWEHDAQACSWNVFSNAKGISSGRNTTFIVISAGVVSRGV